MSEFLYSIDLSLFYAVNHSLSNPVFDWFMPFVTDLNRSKFVLWSVAAVLGWMLWKGEKNVKLAAIALIVTIVASDQFSSHVVKFWFERARPCQSLADVFLRVGCGGGFSFPSSHAVNNFAGAIVLSFYIPRAAKWFYLFAATVAFSRVYIGVHYPLDVLGGAVIGSAIGGTVLALFTIVELRFFSSGHSQRS